MIFTRFLDPWAYNTKLEMLTNRKAIRDNLMKKSESQKKTQRRTRVYLIVHFMPNDVRVQGVYAKKEKADERVLHLRRQYSLNQLKHTFSVLEMKVIGKIL
jgi:hypothetical protein